MKTNITFKRVYEYGGDCKADDTDYICGYRASNGAYIEKKFADGLNVYCWKVGEDYYDTLNAAKAAVIRQADEPTTDAETPSTQETVSEPKAAEETVELETEPKAATETETPDAAQGLEVEQTATDNKPQVVERKPAFEVGRVYRNEAQEAGKNTIKVTARSGYAVTFVWNGQEMTAEVQLDDPDSEYILIGLKPFFASELEAVEETAETEQSEPATESPRSVQETRIDIAAFCKKYAEEYGFLRDNRDNVAGFNEALKAWDAFCESDAHKAFIREFCEYTGDYISSDREAAAFMLALESMTAPPMCEMETEATTKAATPVSQTEPETAAAGQPAPQEDETEMPLTPEQKEWLATTNEPMVEIADLCLDYCDDTSGSALTEEGIEALNQAILARLPQDVEWVGDKLIAPLSFDGDIDADEIISEAWADVMECGNQDYWEND